MTTIVVEPNIEGIVLERGWWPVLGFALRHDGGAAPRIVDWRGGLGEKPPTGFIRADGSLTGDPAQAFQFPVQIAGDANSGLTQSQVDARIHNFARAATAFNDLTTVGVSDVQPDDQLFIHVDGATDVRRIDMGDFVAYIQEAAGVLDAEDVRDEVEAQLEQGDNITLTPSGSGATKKLRIDASGGVPSGTPSPTNLDYEASPTKGTITSSTGDDADIPLVDATNAGLMTPAQRTRLAGIEARATADQTPSQIRDALQGLQGLNKLDYTTALKNVPVEVPVDNIAPGTSTVPRLWSSRAIRISTDARVNMSRVRSFISGAFVRDLLQGLAANVRLDAQYIKGLPEDGLTEAQILALFSTFAQAGALTNDDTEHVQRVLNLLVGGDWVDVETLTATNDPTEVPAIAQELRTSDWDATSLLAATYDLRFAGGVHVGNARFGMRIPKAWLETNTLTRTAWAIGALNNDEDDFSDIIRYALSDSLLMASDLTYFYYARNTPTDRPAGAQYRPQYDVPAELDPDVVVPQVPEEVSDAEIDAGSETDTRLFSPADVARFIESHAPRGGGGSAISDKVLGLAAAAGSQSVAGTHTNRKTVVANSGAVVLSDWGDLTLVADSTAVGGVTATAGVITFANDAKVFVEGSFEFEPTHSGGGARLYNDLRGVQTRGADAMMLPSLRAQTFYTKTTAPGSALQQGPPRQHGEFTWMVDVQAGDTLAIQWRAYLQENTGVDVIAAESSVMVRVFEAGDLPSGDELPSDPEDGSIFRLTAAATWQRVAVLQVGDLGNGNWGYRAGSPSIGSIGNTPENVDEWAWYSNNAANNAGERQRIIVIRDATETRIPGPVTIGGTEYTLEAVPGVAHHWRSTNVVAANPLGTDSAVEIPLTGTWADGTSYTERDAFDAFSELIYAHLNWHHVASAWTPQRIDGRIDARVSPGVIVGQEAGLDDVQLRRWIGTQAQYDALSAYDARTEYLITG